MINHRWKKSAAKAFSGRTRLISAQAPIAERMQILLASISSDMVSIPLAFCVRRWEGEGLRPEVSDWTWLFTESLITYYLAASSRPTGPSYPFPFGICLLQEQAICSLKTNSLFLSDFIGLSSSFSLPYISRWPLNFAAAQGFCCFLLMHNKLP